LSRWRPLDLGQQAVAVLWGTGARLAVHLPVVVVGGPDDIGLGEEIVGAVGRSGGRGGAVNACGKLTLRQSAALIKHAARW